MIMCAEDSAVNAIILIKISHSSSNEGKTSKHNIKTHF